MLLFWLNRLGDWNPQLWREVKQRLSVRSFLLTAALSLLWQWFLVKDLGLDAELLTYGSTHAPMVTIERSQLIWRLSTFNLATLIAFTALWLLMGVGSYLLAKNLLQESRRETLTFLWLSGYSPGKILLGKALGVPILLHWAIGLALPLQLWAAIQAGGVMETLIMDAAIVSISAIVYIVVIQTVVRWKKRAQLWLIAIAANFLFVPCLLFGSMPVWEAREAMIHSIATGSSQSERVLVLVVCMGLLVLLIAMALTCWQRCMRMFNHSAP